MSSKSLLLLETIFWFNFFMYIISNRKLTRIVKRIPICPLSILTNYLLFCFICFTNYVFYSSCFLPAQDHTLQLVVIFSLVSFFFFCEQFLGLWSCMTSTCWKNTGQLFCRTFLNWSLPSTFSRLVQVM